MTPDQKKLPPKVRRVADAVRMAFDLHQQAGSAVDPRMGIAHDREDDTWGVFIQNGDDPADALLLSEKGLSGMRPGSNHMPWGRGQGEAFFVGIILGHLLSALVLEIPVCPTCEAEELAKA